jgi:predicted metal-dependent peptidase
VDNFEKFESAIDYLYEKNNYLAAEVTKLGYPRFSQAIPTAGVGWEPIKKKIIFDFNKEFYDMLNVEQLAFVLGHEASHIFNGHIFTLSNEFNKLKRSNKTTLADINIFRRKFNIAADCVVNDSLTILYGLSRSLDSLMQAVYGKETVGFDCYDMTAVELIPLIKDDTQEGGDSHDAWQSFFDENGNPNKDFTDAVKEFINSKKENSALSDKEAAKIDELEKDLKGFSQSQGAAGNEIGNLKRPIDSGNKESLCWNRLLLEFTDSRKSEDNWTRPSRQLIASYPKVILPSFKDKEQYEIFVAIDTSGSIDYKALSLFISLIKNTPKNFIVKAITFDTQCYEYDIKNDKEPVGGGGTRFDIIETYIQKNLKKYPKVVFVLTDGEGNQVTPQYKNRWCWLLYGYSSQAYCSDMKNYKIFDLIRK